MANFTMADLPGANLTEANLFRANLSNADLTEAFADKDTRWPEGFDPVAAGVIFEDVPDPRGGVRHVIPSKSNDLRVIDKTPPQTKVEVKFQKRLAALRQFVDREGHAMVGAGTVESFEGTDHKLGSWVSSQRTQFKKGLLSAERIASLETVPGWKWDAHEANFQMMLAVLRQFVDREGHSRVPKGHVESFEGTDNNLLNSWVQHKRTGFHRGGLSAERIAALEAISGWDWGEVRGSRNRRQPRG